MAHNSRRSIVADVSSRNQGDQPLSTPPDTPSPPFAPKTKGTVQDQLKEPVGGGRKTPPWEVAKRLAFSPESSTDDAWKMNSDPNIPDLAGTMNPFVGIKLNAAPRRDSEETHQPSEAATQKNFLVAHKEGDAKDSNTYNAGLRDFQQAERESQAGTLPGRAPLGRPTPAFVQQLLLAGRQQIHCAIFALLSTLAYLLVLSERYGLRAPHVFEKLGSLSIILSGLPGACLAYMCYVKMPKRLIRERQKANGDAAGDADDPALTFLSTRLSAQGLAIVRRSQELHRDFSLNVLKALGGFVLWDMLRTYVALWPMLHLSSRPSEEYLAEPPLFGPAPHGAKMGIFGYPPRRMAGHLHSPSLASSLQLVLPLVADGSRLAGLWYSLKSLRQARGTEGAKDEGGARHSWFAGNSQLLLLLVALPVASVALQQAFWSSRCLQPFTGPTPLVGPQAAALAGLLLRCRSVLLAIAAALTGAVLAAAFEGLSIRHSRSSSRILALIASLAFFCCILFDVLAAGARSGGPSCTYLAYTSEIQSGSVGVKEFATAAALAHSLALVCLSASASAFGFRDMLVGAALAQQPIDEAYIW